MARKSNADVLRERLRAISECPFDIFERISEEDVMRVLPDSESGNTTATEELCESIHSSLKAGEVCLALEFLLMRGVRAGSERCAAIAVSYIAASERMTELAGDSLALAPNSPMAPRVNALLVIEGRSVVIPDGITEKEKYAIRAFLAARRGEEPRPYYEALGIIKDGEYTADALALGTEIYFTFGLPAWRDTWLVAGFEFAIARGETYAFMPTILDIFKSRTYDPRSKLYALAALEYLTRVAPNEYKEERNALRIRCAFEGMDVEIDDPLTLIREGVYTDTAAAIKAAKEAELLGYIIEHTRMRYLLEGEVHGKKKRSRMHCWEITVSVRGDGPPELSRLKLDDIRPIPHRGNVTLPRDPEICQIICRGEVRNPDAAIPFEIDLCLDISYVSATKCRDVELRLGKGERIGEYFAMPALLLLY